MELKVNIPTSLDDITVGQFQEIEAISKLDISGEQIDNRILKIFTGIEDANSISKIDRDMLLGAINDAILKEGEFTNRFKLDYVEFGMIPNFDKISGSEYTDLIKYSDSPEELHRLLAVAFRPIKFKDRYKNYQIVNYRGTGELSELMKQTPMSIAKGFNVFFFNLSKDSEAHIRRSTAEELARETLH
jgi:hypothetical protein